eukprot:Phypoly_transcript_14104.p1 GENE.Phypoly_transcript_14104~~Phypoly_transcript_14104.p1  ORF type:complete len:199 (+),score=5.70 Phypoly_transcript_14104:154-750(+)
MDLYETALDILIVFFGMYMCTFIIALGYAWRIFKTSKGKWTITKIVHCLIPVCLLARMSDFVVNVVRARQHKVAFYNPEHQNSQEMFSASLPLYLFFTTYILVCLSWFYFCQQNLPNSTFLLRRILRLYLYINIFVYTCYIIFIIFLSQEKYRNTTHTVETVFASSISFCAGLSFAYFGRRLYLRMRRVSKLNVSKKV